MKRGKFIVVEGLEGAGKSTAIDTIKHYLSDYISEVIETREPGGTRLGEAVRQLIKEKVDNEIIDARSELLLLYAARVQLVEQIIKPALEKGIWVVADRFELSTYAYQGGGRGLAVNLIHQLSSVCLKGFKPDLIFYLDINPELGLSRVKNRGEFDRIEQESAQFFNRVHYCYQQLISSMDNAITIDASQSLKTVQELIIAQLKNRLL